MTTELKNYFSLFPAKQNTSERCRSPNERHKVELYKVFARSKRTSGAATRNDFRNAQTITRNCQASKLISFLFWIMFQGQFLTSIKAEVDTVRNWRFCLSFGNICKTDKRLKLMNLWFEQLKPIGRLYQWAHHLS